MQTKVKIVDSTPKIKYTFKEIKKRAKEYLPECIYKMCNEDQDIFLVINHAGEIFCINCHYDGNCSILEPKPFKEFDLHEYEIFRGTLNFTIKN